MRLSGIFRGKITNHKSGEITCWEKHNLVVKAGFDWIAQLMSDGVNRPQPITHIAFGTGITTTTPIMTTLENEIYRSTVTASWNSLTRELVFTGGIPIQSGLSTSISEVGLFNSNSGGTMFDRATFSPKGVDNDTSFDYTFTITLTE